ncbi:MULTISPECIES: FdhF/YdeP family oxidoreductase [Catenuloplanes]|uniref:Molybdopterin-dependent oxidoreductase alpha subunit n=1 Tax=Catenuloplanes niger TaxID=587534 RepID=A0AAE3ZXQ1_9ACTN|nr:FdhF/YdeP family oxidoreductase [Catenuloplanes niger]MDR7327114.1 molybdopterin-dependent oxidoreductase alpha subunit [Catenuloplanes niger]
MAKNAPTDDVGDRDLHVAPPKQAAAGVPGVLHGLAAAQQQMGVRRSALTLLKLNQAGGFDCPGCAWPEPAPDKRSHFEFCENGAKAVAEEATLRRITPEFFARHSISELAGRSDYWLGQQGRLTTPMIKRADSDHYEPIGWGAAFDTIAAQLNAVEPDQSVFYTSGRTSNEAAFAYQLFVRAYGTNNLPDCSNMCHESSGVALMQTIGIGKGSVTLEDVHRAKLIIVVGQNPGTNHPRMLTALEKAKKAGATIVAVNPLLEAGLLRFKNPQAPDGVVGKGTSLADHYLQIKVGGDLPLFAALGHLLLPHADREFIEAHTAGFAEYAAARATVDWDVIETQTGLERAQIEQVARLMAESEGTIVCWAMGLTQRSDSVPTIREVVNVQLLRGMIGKPGAGLCPVRGHSNVQGDRTMGIIESPPPWVDNIERELGIEVPRRHGFAVVDAIRAMRDGRARFFMALGGNFAAAAPDTDVTLAALASCDMTVHVSTKLNRTHVTPGRVSLILPCLGRTERDPAGFVTVEDSMSAVHASTGRLAPASPDLLSELAIISRLAQATLSASQLPWSSWEASYPAIREVIAKVVPGFDDYEAKVTPREGFTLPHGPRDSREFRTPDRKAHFTVNTIVERHLPPGRLMLQTMRSHDQYNTTIYGMDDRYRGISGGRRVVFVSAKDLAALGLTDGSMVDIVSEWKDGVERRAPGFRLVEYPIAAGCAGAYFPEANVLVPLDSTAELSHTPTSKEIVVRLEPVA